MPLPTRPNRGLHRLAAALQANCQSAANARRGADRLGYDCARRLDRVGVALAADPHRAEALRVDARA